MAFKLSSEQRFLCTLLAKALNRECMSEEDRRKFAALNKKEILHIAEQHKVLPLLYDVLHDDGGLEEGEKRRLETLSRQTVRQGYRLLFLTKHLTEALNEEHIPVVVLKGCGVAAWYPVPELRKAGDIDLQVREAELDAAYDVLAKRGYRISEVQHANHHRVCSSQEGIDVELHVIPAEPFSDTKVNDRMKELSEDFVQQRVYRECMGVTFPVLSDAYQAIQLLLHMLQHFLRAGFGLKLLCDWTVFWNGQHENGTWEAFEQLAESFGILEFARTVTESCVDFMGLHMVIPERCQNKKLAEEFLSDVFDSEEFGKASTDRMVIVQGTGLKAYWKEFHYQMKMNHPKASRCILFWPILWVVTLFVFLYNNRKLKRGSVSEIMKSAGRRSTLVQQMGLWGKED